MKKVIVTTEHRGVFYAQLDESTDLTKTTLTGLKNCRMVIRFGTDRGLQQLCETGPTRSSLLSATSDIAVLHKVTAVFEVSEKAAAEVWK